MTEIINYACNVDNGKDLCMDSQSAMKLHADAMPVSAKSVAAAAAKPEGEPACSSEQAVHDARLVAHMDAFTQGKFSGQGIGQADVSSMLKSPEFTSREKDELKSISLMIPHVQELFHTPDVTKAKMGAAIAWECPAKS